MDSLISMMATGTPEEFAEKLGIRRSIMDSPYFNLVCNTEIKKVVLQAEAEKPE